MATLETRISALEQINDAPCGFPTILVRPDGQTDQERIVFDADLKRRHARGEHVILIGPDDDPIGAFAELCV